MTARRLRLPVLLLLFAARTQPLSAQVAGASAQRQRFAGCYDTHLGSWSGPLPSGVDDVAITPPAQFQLDTVAVSPSRFVVLPARLGGGRMTASWVLRGADSILVIWSTGFVGVSLALAVHQDSLIGRATTHHDAIRIGEPPDPSAPIIATRRVCPPPRSGQSTETVPTP